MPREHPTKSNDKLLILVVTGVVLVGGGIWVALGAPGLLPPKPKVIEPSDGVTDPVEKVAPPTWSDFPIPEHKLDMDALAKAKGAGRVPLIARELIRQQVDEIVKWSRVLVFGGRPLGDVLPVIVDGRKKLDELLRENHASPEVRKVVSLPVDRLEADVRAYYATR